MARSEVTVSASGRIRPERRGKSALHGLVGAAIAALALSASGCASKPLVPYSTETAPLVLLPIGDTGVQDKRGRFREIYCAVLEQHGRDLPDYRPCDEALTRVGTEPPASGRPVELGPSQRHLVAVVVGGIGFECITPWLAPAGTTANNLHKYGYDLRVLKVDALSGTTRNARQIRDALMAMDEGPGEPRLVLIGYSKGIDDLLEAVVTYPEIRSRVAAVVSAAGAVGGSPLANDAEQYQANLFVHFPRATCDSGDGGGVESLRPQTRKAWLAQHPLPSDLRYYSLVTFPHPDRISSILQSSYKKLSRIDGRNDSQVIFYDQIVPNSVLVGYVNADHWALALPIARTHTTISSVFVTKNDYPREALSEAMLRFVEEDLSQSAH
jgi:hypothetical protein